MEEDPREEMRAYLVEKVGQLSLNYRMKVSEEMVDDAFGGGFPMSAHAWFAELGCTLLPAIDGAHTVVRRKHSDESGQLTAMPKLDL